MTYTNEVKTQALALAFRGYSSLRIVQELAVAFGDSIPDARTVRNWRREFPEISTEQDQRILENSREIAVRAQRLTIDTLDMMEPDPKYLTQLNIVAGTAIDKIHQDKQLNRGPDTTNNFYFAIQQAERDIKAGLIPISEPIEGEYSDTPRDE